MKTFPKFLLSTIALAAAASAGAETVIDPAVTVNLSGWTYGTGHAVNVATPTFGGEAGGFKGALSNAGPYDNASFETYCVELGQVFGFGQTYNNYRIVQGNTYDLWANNPATAGQIGQLVTYANSLGAMNDVKSTGLQLAIWELVYETPANGWSLTGGAFADSLNSASRAFGDSLLAGFSNTASMYNVDVLASGNSREGNQDFLILTAVPEPEGYALAFAGLACIGLFGRKFRAAKKA